MSDPVLEYSTYLGGSGDDVGFGIAVDTSGSVYVTVVTRSSNFPTTGGALQPTFGGGDLPSDVFVTKLNAGGDAFVYSTYLGGSGNEGEFGPDPAIAVDASGNVYVTGSTQSTDFPTVAPLQPTFGGGSTLFGDAFVAKIAPSVDLALTKTDSPDPVTSGNNLTYIVTVTNNGPDPTTGIVVAFALWPMLLRPQAPLSSAPQRQGPSRTPPACRATRPTQ